MSNGLPNERDVQAMYDAVTLVDLLACGPYEPGAKPCVRLFDANNALLPRTGGCCCNTLDCPHRPAKGA